MDFLTVQSRRIEYVRLQSKNPAPDSPTMVMLHEGLGSISMWRDFPQQLADATGCEVLVYSRYGYGNSEPVATSRSVYFMHEEALDFLPDLLDQLDIQRPILFGHSDGGSIALIHAGGAGREVSAVIVMAPHVFIEDVTVNSIAAAKAAYENGTLRDNLSRYHKDVDLTFLSWTNVWLHPESSSWNIEEYLPAVACPVLAIQGVEDEFGTMEQIEIIARAVKQVELLKLAACKHSPHKDQPRAVLKAVATFVDTVMESRGSSVGSRIVTI